MCSAMRQALNIFSFILFLLVHIYVPVQAETAVANSSLRETIETLSSFDSRATGSPGYEKSAAFIEKRLLALGLNRKHITMTSPSAIYRRKLTFSDRKIPLVPIINNAITPQTTDGLLSAPLYYVGKGHLEELDGKKIQDSIVLIDFDSGRNWQMLASLGAKAAIFLQGDNS